MPEGVRDTAAKTILGKTPRPTSLASLALRRAWEQRIKEHSVFSARTTSQKYVEMIQKRLAEVASRKVSPQEAERMLRRTLEDIGYRPETGFPDARGRVPPAKPGAITDLSSSRRIQLILDTNVKQARSLGQVAASENPMTLMSLPAWKLTRTGARKKPRGNWPKRWAAAGAACGWKGASRRQMVALKTSPIWQKLADGEGGFRDTLGSPYPPFAFGSGMAWVNVSRKEWQRMCAAEGIDDGLQEINAKAKELASGAAERGTGRPQGGVPSRPQPGVKAPFSLTALFDEIEEPKDENPLVEPVPSAQPPSGGNVAGLFEADLGKRDDANDDIDDAADSVRAFRAEVETWRDDADELASKLGARRGSAERMNAADTVKGYVDRFAAVAGNLRELEGRLATYGNEVEEAPIPVDAESQERFDDLMDRYAAAARATATRARELHDGARMRHEAAERIKARFLPRRG